MNAIEKKTILIIDDMELNRGILSLILNEKYNTMEADNGAEAMKILEREGRKISLILLDIIMPVMDGFRFLQEIQNNIRLNRIPIIFVTSETNKENIVEGMKMGVRDVIAKPFDPYLVCRRVDNLIRLTESREDSRQLTAGYVKKEGRPTALIVDDVEVNRTIIKNTIEESYCILEAADGREALFLLEKYRNEIAVVLLDIIMPVMDGVQMMEEANHKGLLKHIPVVAITSEDSLPKIRKIKGLGICEVIHKPFNAFIVKNRVDYLVELYHSSKD